MGILQLSSPYLSSLSLPSNIYNKAQKPLKFPNHLNYSRGRIKAVDTTISGTESEANPQEEPPSIDFAFVHSVLLPDGSPDIHTRSACGGQKLRDIMLDGDIDLYGPYARALLNCGGGGTCGTCLVEVADTVQDGREKARSDVEVIQTVKTLKQVVAGKELLNPRTDKEKEILKKKPKTWRLACQTMVGKEDSRGQVVIQTLPEWKAHEWD